jgi:hypothetical protein
MYLNLGMVAVFLNLLNLYNYKKNSSFIKFKLNIRNKGIH